MYADDTYLSSAAQDPDILEFKKLPLIFDNMMCQKFNGAAVTQTIDQAFLVKMD